MESKFNYQFFTSNTQDYFESYISHCVTIVYILTIVFYNKIHIFKLSLSQVYKAFCLFGFIFIFLMLYSMQKWYNFRSTANRSEAIIIVFPLLSLVRQANIFRCGTKCIINTYDKCVIYRY